MVNPMPKNNSGMPIRFTKERLDASMNCYVALKILHVKIKIRYILHPFFYRFTWIPNGNAIWRD